VEKGAVAIFRVNKSGDIWTLIEIWRRAVRGRATFRLATLSSTSSCQIQNFYPMNLTFTLPEDRDCNVNRNVWIFHSSPGIILKADPRRRSSAAKAWRLELQTAAVSAEIGTDNRALFLSEYWRNWRTQDNPIGVRQRLKEVGKASWSVGACEHAD